MSLAPTLIGKHIRADRIDADVIVQAPRSRVATGTASFTLTKDDPELIIIMDGVKTITLPTPTIGMKFSFVAGEDLSSITTVAAGSAIIRAGLFRVAVATIAATYSNILFTANASVGDRIDFVAINGVWSAMGFSQHATGINVS